MKRLLFLPFLLLFAGCGVTAVTKRQPAPPRPAAAKAATTVSVPRPKAFVADRVIASRTGSFNMFDVRLAITHLERTGATTSLSVGLTSADPNYAPWIRNYLDDGETQAIRGSDSRENGDSVDGIYLLDRTHGQKYLVARDPDGRCICDVGIGDLRVDDHSVTLSATYGAPPPEVHAVDVVVPRFGTFANVPLG
jgi:hypothetical protein